MYASARTACAKFDQNERIGPIDLGRSKSSRNDSRSLGDAARSASGLRLRDDDRRRQILDQVRRDAERTVARAAAAVRNRERLVRVEMHEVETHVARTRVAHHRVGVGAVVVHQAAGRVHRGRDLGDVILEEAERVRIGHHADGRIGPEHACAIRRR